MKKIKLIVCFVLISFFAAAQSAIGDRSKGVSNSSNLKSVKIGDQVWSAENLNADRFANGDLILEVKSARDWVAAGENQQPAWCYYNNESFNGSVYGKLYNWYAAADPRGLCRSGWHVPSDAEWTVMVNSIGGSEIAGGKMKEIGLTHWSTPNLDASNASGFTGVPGGSRGDYENGFDYVRYWSYYWSSTKYSSLVAIGYGLSYCYSSIKRGNYDKTDGFSIRCVKD